MNGDVEIFALNEMESVNMLLRRISALFTREIEAHYSSGAKIHGQFRHLKRNIHIAHRANDQTRSNAKVFPRSLQSFQYRANNLLMS